MCHMFLILFTFIIFKHTKDFLYKREFVVIILTFYTLDAMSVYVFQFIFLHSIQIYHTIMSISIMLINSWFRDK